MDKDATPEQKGCRSERLRNPGETQKRWLQHYVETGDPALAAQREASERGVVYRNRHVAIKTAQRHRKWLMENCPRYYQEILDQLGGAKATAQSTARVIAEGKSATAIHGGRDTGLPDHRARQGAVKIETQIMGDLMRQGAAITQGELSAERVEIEQEKAKALGAMVKEGRPVVQIVLQLPDGGEQAFDTKCVVDIEPAALPKPDDKEPKV